MHVFRTPPMKRPIREHTLERMFYKQKQSYPTHRSFHPVAIRVGERGYHAVNTYHGGGTVLYVPREWV